MMPSTGWGWETPAKSGISDNPASARAAAEACAVPGAVMTIELLRRGLTENLEIAWRHTGSGYRGQVGDNGTVAWEPAGDLAPGEVPEPAAAAPGISLASLTEAS